MDKLNFIDIFSQTPLLRIKNSTHFFTLFSLLVSLTTILSIFTITIYFIHSCFSRTNYQILERMEYKNIPQHKIFENKIGLTIIDPLGKEFKDHERLFSIDAKMWNMSPKKENNTPVIDNIPAVNCSIYVNEPFEKDYTDLNQNFPTSKCLDFSNLKKNLYGKYASLFG